MAKKAPGIKSAAATARVISRRLKAAGVRMSTIGETGDRTEGMYAYRVGCSKDVGVSHWSPVFNGRYARSESPKEFARRAMAYARVRELLAEWGYVVEGPGIYITCNRP